MNWTLKSLAEHVDGSVLGDENHTIHSIATLKNAQQDQLSFLSNSKYKKHLAESNAGVVIVNDEMSSLVPHNALVVKDPYVAYARIASLINPLPSVIPGIDSSAAVSDKAEVHPTASIQANSVIETDVSLGENVLIGPGCVVRQGSKIAKGTRLIANVTVCETVTIGENCIIHPGAVIGSDGFGIANNQGQWIKIPQIGSVEIGNNVEIGANTTIDRGAIENTVIGDGVKLDNQIQIGHNVTIGDNTVIAGCVGIAGSTSVGKNCAIGGGTGINGHLNITDGVQLTGMSMVTKSISQPGSYSSGIPVEPTQNWHKNVIRYRQLEKLNERVKHLEK